MKLKSIIKQILKDSDDKERLNLETLIKSIEKKIETDNLDLVLDSNKIKSKINKMIVNGRINNNGFYLTLNSNSSGKINNKRKYVEEINEEDEEIHENNENQNKTKKNNSK